MEEVKYKYKGFTPLENEVMKLLKDFRSFVKENYPDANYIRIVMMNLRAGYIDVTIGDDNTTEDKVDRINLVVWDTEGIEDEETDTDE